MTRHSSLCYACTPTLMPANQQHDRIFTLLCITDSLLQAPEGLTERLVFWPAAKAQLKRPATLVNTRLPWLRSAGTSLSRCRSRPPNVRDTVRLLCAGMESTTACRLQSLKSLTFRLDQFLSWGRRLQLCLRRRMRHSSTPAGRLNRTSDESEASRTDKESL